MHVEFDVFLFRDESGAFIARVPALAGCHSWGRSEDEALRNVEDAIRLALDEGEPPASSMGVRQVSVSA